VAAEVKDRGARDVFWGLPVVGETWDGRLNDINGFHVRPEHVFSALAGASGGPVAEGNVGGGTGMVCHGFKGGIGTSSRLVTILGEQFAIGVLVQANHGRRERLRVDGVPVGEEVTAREVPLADVPETAASPADVAAVSPPAVPPAAAAAREGGGS